MPSQQRPRLRSSSVLPGLGWLSLSLVALAAFGGATGGPAEAASGPILEVVRSICLSAFETSHFFTAQKHLLGVTRKVWLPS
jgi:hypothetical protein